MDKERENDIREDGENFGYPKCCIDAFVNTYDNFNDLSYDDGRSERKLFGSGFVPCVKCHETKTEQQLVDEINANRKFPLRFPMQFVGHTWLPKDLQQQMYDCIAEKARTDFKEDLERLKKIFREETALDFMITELYIFGIVRYRLDDQSSALCSN